MTPQQYSDWQDAADELHDEIQGEDGNAPARLVAYLIGIWRGDDGIG